MPFRSSRPTYALVLLALSVIFLCTTFVPFLYSLLFPNEEIERVVAALKEGGTAPMDAESVVSQAKATAGPLTRAIPIASSYETAYGFHFSGTQPQSSVSSTGRIYLAWFQKYPKPVMVAITLYADEAGRRAYRISQIDSPTIARGYGIPIVLFGVALFLARRRKSSPQPAPRRS